MKKGFFEKKRKLPEFSKKKRPSLNGWVEENLLLCRCKRKKIPSGGEGGGGEGLRKKRGA